MSRIVRRSGCETPRLVPPKFSRMAMQRPEFPHDASSVRPRSADARPKCKALPRDCASPTWGRIGKNLCCVSANCAKTDAFSTALRPLPSSESSSRRDGQGPHRSHQLRLPREPELGPGSTSTGRPRRKTAPANPTLLAAGPWLSWLPLDLLDRLPGTPLRPCRSPSAAAATAPASSPGASPPTRPDPPRDTAPGCRGGGWRAPRRSRGNRPARPHAVRISGPGASRRVRRSKTA